jgi:hypothetical protein
MTRLERQGSGWKGWCGSNSLYVAAPEDAPQEALMAALAEQAKKTAQMASVILDTPTHHRVIGWGYTPPGYANTPDGPRLWLLVIEGDSLRR